MQSSNNVSTAFPQSSLPEKACSWRCYLPDSLRERTLQVAQDVIDRLRNPDQMLAIAATVSQQTSLPLRFNPSSLIFGFNGPALPCAYFAQCFPGQGWDVLAHHYLNAPLDEVLARPSLFGGSSGIAAILDLLAGDTVRYAKTREQLKRRICEQVCQHPRWITSHKESAESDYDLISGASGVLAYLIALSPSDEQIQRAVKILLNYLLQLATVDQQPGYEHWYISPRYLHSASLLQRYPDGYFNCGLAHGIPGPLAALSLAWLKGYRVEGQHEAILYLSDWLLRHQVTDEWGVNWPDFIPRSLACSRDDWSKLPGTHSAWCYGAPGIAQVLWLAGTALEDAALCETAVEALEAVVHRPAAARRIISPTICHGIAGLLAICLRFAQRTENALIQEHIPLLVGQILDHYDSDLPLCFRDLEHTGVGVDQPGWLTGASGIAMVLLAAALPIVPVWDHLLFLS